MLLRIHHPSIPHTALRVISCMIILDFSQPYCVGYTPTGIGGASLPVGIIEPVSPSGGPRDHFPPPHTHNNSVVRLESNAEVAFGGIKNTASSIPNPLRCHAAMMRHDIFANVTRYLVSYRYRLIDELVL